MTATATLPRRQLIFATAGVMLALLLAALDQTIVGTAMPRIVAELHGLNEYSWLITGYLVSSTVVTPIAGKLGDLFGRKPFLIAGMVGFVLASWVCGAAQNMNQLIVFRVVQGVFGGFLFASAFTVLADIFPPRQRAKMQGLFGAVFGLSSIVGPIVGGWLTDNWGWRWVFFVNAPVGVLGVLVVLGSLPYIRSKATWRDIDFAGAVTLAAGLIPLLISLSITRDHGWTSPEVLGLFGFAAVMLVAFYVIEHRAAEPIVPFSLFRNRTFSVSVIVGGLSSMGMFGMIIFVPLELQGVLGVSVTNSGLLLTPMMLGLILFSVVSGQLMVRLKHYRYLGTAGLALMVVGMWMLAQTNVSSRQFDVTRAIFVIGGGLGLTFPLYINAVQSALPTRYLGVASSQIQFWRNMGGTITTAVLGSILAQRLPGAINDEMAKVKLPAGFALPKAIDPSNPNGLLDPTAIAKLEASLPPQALPVFEQAFHAVKVALASTLHDLFMVAVALTLLALIVSVFLKEVPLRSRSQMAMVEAAEGDSPVREAAQPEPVGA